MQKSTKLLLVCPHISSWGHGTPNNTLRSETEILWCNKSMKIIDLGIGKIQIAQTRGGSGFLWNSWYVVLLSSGSPTTEVETRKANQLQMKYKEQKRKISEHRREATQVKTAKIEWTKRRNYVTKEILTSQMLYYGLWQNGAQVDPKLKDIKTKSENVKALRKVQLNFRKSILNQPGDNSLFH